MAAFRANSAGVFELQRSSSFQAPPPSKHQQPVENEDMEAADSEASQGESDLEEKVDVSVREDMGKLEDTFPGISDRFRLVNRIGEGMLP